MALGKEDRARLRAEKNEFYQRKFMAGRKPTPRQLSYLRRLGYRKTPMTRIEAAALIKRLAAGRSKRRAA